MARLHSPCSEVLKLWSMYHWWSTEKRLTIWWWLSSFILASKIHYKTANTLNTFHVRNYYCYRDIKLFSKWERQRFLPWKGRSAGDGTKCMTMIGGHLKPMYKSTDRKGGVCEVLLRHDPHYGKKKIESCCLKISDIRSDPELVFLSKYQHTTTTSTKYL